LYFFFNVSSNSAEDRLQLY